MGQVVNSEGEFALQVELVIDHEILNTPGPLARGDGVIVEDLPYSMPKKAIRELEFIYGNAGWKINFRKDDKKKCYICTLEVK